MIFAAHITQYIDIVIAAAWAMAGAVYYLSTAKNSQPVRRILRPLRLFGMWLSLTWCAWYLVLFLGLVEDFGRPGFSHSVIDGLILTTAVFLVAVSTTASRMLRQLGVE